MVMMSCMPDTTVVVAVAVVIDFEELHILEFILLEFIHVHLGYLSLFPSSLYTSLFCIRRSLLYM